MSSPLCGVSTSQVLHKADDRPNGFSVLKAFTTTAFTTSTPTASQFPLADRVMAATITHYLLPITTMQLSEFPQLIAAAQHNLLAQDQKVRRLKDTLLMFDREIDAQIAFDSELKNDTQRKARKAELQATEDYQGLLLDLRQAQDQQTELEIEVELLRSQFSVAKLERREAIASMELAASQQAA